MLVKPLHWRHNGRDSVSNQQPHDCFLNRLFRHRSKQISKLRVTGLCVGISPGTGEFPAQMASNAENVSIWWRHHSMRIRGRGLCFHNANKMPEHITSIIYFKSLSLPDKHLTIKFKKANRYRTNAVKFYMVNSVYRRQSNAISNYTSVTSDLVDK